MITSSCQIRKNFDFCFNSYPELQSNTSEFYTQEQIKSLMSYAADREEFELLQKQNRRKFISLISPCYISLLRETKEGTVTNLIGVEYVQPEVNKFPKKLVSSRRRIEWNFRRMLQINEIWPFNIDSVLLFVHNSKGVSSFSRFSSTSCCV